MPVWGWVVLATAVVVVVVLLAWLAWRTQRTRRLKSRFGPEYERTLEEREDRREAEADLTARQRRRSQLEIKPLETGVRQQYAEAWQRVQTEFVDQPVEAVRNADRLVTDVMRARGYPMEDFDQRAADVSVDHPHIVDNYRAAHHISLTSNRNEATTEDLRKAMVHYPVALFGTSGGASRGTGGKMMADHRDHDRDFSTSDMAERSSEGDEATGPPPPPPRGRAGPPLEQPSANESTTQGPRSDLPRVEDDDASVEPLIDPEEASSLQEKWERIQARFVDEPQRSVEQADALVAEALQRVAHSFSSGREALEGQWSRGEDVSTEDLRQIFRLYRSFFERLLSV